MSCTDPPPDVTVICADEIGPVVLRASLPAPGWSPDEHRIKNEPDHSRDPEKNRVRGGLCVRDGIEATMTRMPTRDGRSTSGKQPGSRAPC